MNTMHPSLSTENPSDPKLLLSVDVMEFLAYAIARKKSKRSSYSMRCLARDTGLSPGMLSQFKAGKKILSSKNAELVANRLDLNAFEKMYFEALLDLAKAPSPSSRASLKRRLGSIRQAARTDRVTAATLKGEPLEWWHLATYSCCGLDGFKITPENVAKQLGLPLSKAQAAIERLTLLGWIQVNEKGIHEIDLSHKDLSDAWTAKSLRKYQLDINERSARRITSQGLPDVTKVGMIAIDPNRIPLIEKEAQAFFAKIREIADRGEKATAVYTLYFHCFEVKE